MLCQDCLCIRPYTYRQEGIELCDCGGELCGCEICRMPIIKLLKGERERRKIFDYGAGTLPWWNPRHGLNGLEMEIDVVWQFVVDLFENDKESDVKGLSALCLQLRIEPSWGPRCTAELL